MKRFLQPLATVAIMALLVGPAAAQLPDLPVDVPDVPVDVPSDLPVDVPVEVPVDVPVDVTDLPVDLADILDTVGPLLDPASPVLGVVNDVITQLQDLIDLPLVNQLLANLLALQGDDAIDAAIAFSQATYETSDTALLARDDLFADALTTGALQGIYDAPLLLTTSSDLDPRTARELIRLGVDNLVILGAEGAIDRLVVQKLTIAGLDVVRLGGPTRIETATTAASAGAPNATTAVLTRAYPAQGSDDSQAFADLLAVSPWAAENDWPVLLTQTDALTPSVASYLADSAITDIVIIGGDGAVSAPVEQALQAMGITTRRVSGSNRFATAVAIANERGFSNSGDTDRLILAEGTSSRPDVWAPGFAGAAHGAQHNAPILLTAGDQIPAETLAFITDGLGDNLLDGGPAAICASFVSPIACEAAGLLLLGNLAPALDLLGLGLADLPNLDDILAIIENATGIDLPDLPDLPLDVNGVLEDPLGTVSDILGDLPVVGDTVTGVTDEVLDTVGGVVGGTVDDVVAPVDDATGGVVDGVVDDVVGGLPGGGSSEDGGSPEDGGSGGILDDIISGIGGLG